VGLPGRNPKMFVKIKFKTRYFKVACQNKGNNSNVSIFNEG
jgi:hypothetical protein